MAACIIVYDCTDEKTFSNIKHWINSIKEHAPIDVVKIIVGNKCDLDSQREVPLLVAQDFAKSNGLKHFETSALTGQGVQEIFEYVGRKVKENIDLGLLDHKELLNQRKSLTLKEDTLSRTHQCFC